MISAPARERAAALAIALAPHDVWARVEESDLMRLVASELGDPDVLDSFVAPPGGGPRRRAFPRSPILHIVAGNTPAAALQSLARGLLAGAHNRLKLPSDRSLDNTVAQFCAELPQPLRSAVESRHDLPGAWVAEAEAVAVSGNDETVAAVAARLRPDQALVAYGHRLSFGIVFDDPDHASVPLAARDVIRFDQLGCLSPHDFYVGCADGGTGAAAPYAEALAKALAQAETDRPRRAVAPAEAAAIRDLRGSYRFRSAQDPGVQLWESPGGTAWTVICEPDPLFAISPLNRTVFVKPLPADLPAALRFVRPHLSTVAIWPWDMARAAAVASTTGSPRVCQLGEAQSPDILWHQDGRAGLHALVRWVDLG